MNLLEPVEDLSLEDLFTQQDIITHQMNYVFNTNLGKRIEITPYFNSKNNTYYLKISIGTKNKEHQYFRIDV